MRRHERRLHMNLRHRTTVQKWCEKNGFQLRITNNGHHWQLTKGQFLAEWWPSSAKLVINKKWYGGTHCHDFQQTLKTISNAYQQQEKRGD